ncbi:MAG: MBOAT family protein [Spirochaetes bacterium]|nr:MBOAT family protein [Spirochaetota bacterium]
MPFSYFEYAFIFLPIVIGVYYFLNAKGPSQSGKAWLLICSLLFYVYLSPMYLPLLLISIIVNFYLGRALGPGSEASRVPAMATMTFGVLFNVALLGYYKYADFFIENINAVAGSDIAFLKIIMPIGISYFTLLQIAFLVDTYRGKLRENGFLSYSLFVAFFPKIIQGPIALQPEMVPQFDDSARGRFNAENFSRGLLFFSIGLIKKLVIADNLGIWAAQGYDHAAVLTLLEGWLTMLAFCFQLYFDFSGYTDIAIGAGLMLNIRIPDNFNSPYKSLTYQDLWRRWHITLGRFLREYIYIPLGGNRQGEIRTHINLLVTFIIGGLWHGAAWTFVLWGAMNGLGLMVHRIWRRTGRTMHRFAAWLLTFAWWNVTLVMWRATDYEQALKVYRSLLGLDGVVLPERFRFLSFLEEAGVRFGPWLSNVGEKQSYLLYFILASIVICFFTKNSQELADRLKPSMRWAIFVSVLLGIGIIHMTQVSEFIYARF